MSFEEQIGLDEQIDVMINVFCEIRRVLKEPRHGMDESRRLVRGSAQQQRCVAPQDDGWWVRSEIIGSGTTQESVDDRQFCAPQVCAPS
ncbi:hypothetical protein [Ensifer adhaerens]|uniref:hypothetical protein n=1 Tax=Ensifer adhaerens TaxID=106592 RepID=UPI00156A48C0|nr:hypothetical protein [Ensifer adhaerens]